MAKYKPYSYAQGKFISVYFSKQILPGTFEYALNHLIDNEFNMAIFDSRYANDESGRPAYDPRILLKIVLYAYSKGIVSSRKIEQCCRDNVMFMALSADTRPHFTTISDFIASLDKEVIRLFRDVLVVCDGMGLIGREMFAVDGVKMSSNASKEWSGTREDYSKKVAKLEQAIGRMIEKHREMDRSETGEDVAAREKQYIETIQRQARKLKEWLSKNDDKPGKTGKPRKSNITDNESAKMKTSKGVIQGYDGVAVVDSKHQIVVTAEAFGEAQEHDLLKPMVAGTKENFTAIGDPDILAKVKLTSDSGFHSEENMKMLAIQEIDGYVADNQFRKRDPRFIDRDRYKERFKKEQRAGKTTKDLFTAKDFTFAEDLSHAICPAGKRLYRSGANATIKNFQATKFKGPKSACGPCHLRSQCLRHSDRTEIRQVAYFKGRSEHGKTTFTEKMKAKIDSVLGRMIYSKRLGTVEPVFANICFALGLKRFTLRGKKKVNIQWNLFCIVHNLLKIHRFGPGFA